MRYIKWSGDKTGSVSHGIVSDDVTMTADIYFEPTTKGLWFVKVKFGSGKIEERRFWSRDAAFGFVHKRFGIAGPRHSSFDVPTSFSKF